jgi:ABC-type branched-subunit amino acid transport system ATPase component
MHEGRVIVEGTPDEIRANELVHELYLGTPQIDE